MYSFLSPLARVTAAAGRQSPATPASTPQLRPPGQSEFRLHLHLRRGCGGTEQKLRRDRLPVASFVALSGRARDERSLNVSPGHRAEPPLRRHRGITNAALCWKIGSLPLKRKSPERAQVTNAPWGMVARLFGRELTNQVSALTFVRLGREGSSVMIAG